MDRNEYLSFLEGHEILSIYFEGVVGVFGGQIWRDGKIIDTDPSRETLKILVEEYFEQEL